MNKPNILIIENNLKHFFEQINNMTTHYSIYKRLERTHKIISQDYERLQKATFGKDLPLLSTNQKNNLENQINRMGKIVEDPIGGIEICQPAAGQIIFNESKKQYDGIILSATFDDTLTGNTKAYSIAIATEALKLNIAVLLTTEGVKQFPGQFLGPEIHEVEKFAEAKNIPIIYSTGNADVLAIHGPQQDILTNYFTLLTLVDSHKQGDITVNAHGCDYKNAISKNFARSKETYGLAFSDATPNSLIKQPFGESIKLIGEEIALYAKGKTKGREVQRLEAWNNNDVVVKYLNKP